MSALRDLQIDGNRRIPADLLRVRFSRSGGPGGQNVNKVASKVDLRLDLEKAIGILSVEEVARIRTKLENRLDEQGQLFVVASEYRDQPKNIEAASVRMEALIREALVRQKLRRKTKPTKGSKERRLAGKKHRAQLKKDRGGFRDD